MKLSNVFYGFTKDGKYRCLYKKYKVYDTQYGDVIGTIYVDLEKKCEIDTSQVDEATLQPITNLITGKRRTRRKIINSYKKEFDRSVDISHLFYGNIVYYLSPFMDAGYEDIEKTTKVITERDVLFRGTSNCFAKDFKTNQDYFIINNKIQNVKVNEFFINDVRTVAKDFATCEMIQSKRKILEMDYRKEL